MLNKALTCILNSFNEAAFLINSLKIVLMEVPASSSSLSAHKPKTPEIVSIVNQFSLSMKQTDSLFINLRSVLLFGLKEISFVLDGVDTSLIEELTLFEPDVTNYLSDLILHLKSFLFPHADDVDENGSTLSTSNSYVLEQMEYIHHYLYETSMFYIEVIGVFKSSLLKCKPVDFHIPLLMEAMKRKDIHQICWMLASKGNDKKEPSDLDAVLQYLSNNLSDIIVDGMMESDYSWISMDKLVTKMSCYHSIDNYNSGRMKRACKSFQEPQSRQFIAQVNDILENVCTLLLAVPNRFSNELCLKISIGSSALLSLITGKEREDSWTDDQEKTWQSSKTKLHQKKESFLNTFSKVKERPDDCCLVQLLNRVNLDFLQTLLDFQHFCSHLLDFPKPDDKLKVSVEKLEKLSVAEEYSDDLKPARSLMTISEHQKAATEKGHRKKTFGHRHSNSTSSAGTADFPKISTFKRMFSETAKSVSNHSFFKKNPYGVSASCSPTQSTRPTHQSPVLKIL